MSSNTPESVAASSASCRSEDVSLSKWVNEPLLPWTEILSPDEVVRLTRRHRWMLRLLTLLGRFPPVLRLRGRVIGWLRNDVEQWLEYQRTVPPMDPPSLPSCRLMNPHDQHRRVTRCSMVRRDSGRHQLVRQSANSAPDQPERQWELRL